MLEPKCLTSDSIKGSIFYKSFVRAIFPQSQQSKASEEILRIFAEAKNVAIFLDDKTNHNC